MSASPTTLPSAFAGQPPPNAPGTALRIKQPYEIQPNDIWYFQTFISHSGAVGGQHIPKAEVERRLEAQSGHGQLVQIEGVWHWKLNDPS